MTMDLERLRRDVQGLAAQGDDFDRTRAGGVVARLRQALREGEVRAARPVEGEWRAVEWVKAGILLAFRAGETAEYVPFPTAPNAPFGGSTFQWFDRDTLPLRPTDGVGRNVRIVPGGSSIRDGAYVGRNVVIMPPAYINIGAWVDEGAMVDSHALVGSCAQVGRRVHLSAGAQLGGVLEPVGLRPVVIEDDVLLGGNVGVFEGTLVGRRSVLAPGVQLTRSTVVHDLVNGRTIRASEDTPLTIPEGAVVVPGSRPATGDWAREKGLQLYCPVIVKYRDERTDAAAALEEALR